LSITTGMKITLPPMIAIGGHKLLGTLDISQKHHLIGFSIHLKEFGMAPLVGIGIYEEPVVIQKILMAIHIDLGIGTALPLFHLWL